MIIDYKNSEFTSPAAVLNEDGTLTLDLDTLFGADILTNQYNEQGTFQRDGFSPFKIASNRKDVYSHFAGKMVTIYDHYSFGGWDATTENRIVDNGPMVQGPHAYMFELGTALTAHKQPPTFSFYVETGDKVTLRGTTYLVKFNKQNKYPELTAI